MSWEKLFDISQSRFRMQRLFFIWSLFIPLHLYQMQRKRRRGDGVDLIDHNLDVARFGLTLSETKLSHPDQTRIASSSPQICGWFRFLCFFVSACVLFDGKGVSVTPLHGYTQSLLEARHWWHLMWHGCVCVCWEAVHTQNRTFETYVGSFWLS